MFLVMSCFMAVFGLFLMRKLVWDLIDEVHDCGDSLLSGMGARSNEFLSQLLPRPLRSWMRRHVEVN